MRLVLMGAGALLLAACATKSYPDIPRLSDYEKQNMSCQDLAAEMRKSSEYEWAIIAESNPDLNDVTGYLLNSGIGNAMALDDARQALRERRRDLVLTYREKDC